MAAVSEKILISACFLGQRVRYDGGDNLIASEWLNEWQRQGRLVPVCPEMAGGLPAPRPPAEIQAGDGHSVWQGAARVRTIEQEDVTEIFIRGAQVALQKARQNRCRYALLAARSPSCGNGQIYDGHFADRLVDGFGVTAALLSQHGIEVFNETEIQQLVERMS